MTPKKANAPQAATREAFCVKNQKQRNFEVDTTLITDKQQGASAQILPRHMTLMLFGQPVRALNRCDETWLVVNDLLETIGINPRSNKNWARIPEMERDVDLFADAGEKKKWLKIVTAKGIPALLENVSPTLTLKVTHWAQASVALETA